MNMDQLRCFLSVARHRNFTGAAKEFYLTQPAVTHQISALEKELDAQLFTRTTRSVTLTRAGELFLEDAKRMLDQEERALERLRQLKGSDQPELKIGYLNSPCRHFLPQILAAYQERYPQVRLELVRKNAAGLQEADGGKPFDFIFSVLPDLEQLGGYTCRKLTSDRYCLVAPKTHPCLSNAEIDCGKLATEPFAVLSKSAGGYMYGQMRQICRELGFSPRIVAEYSALEDVVFSVECGQALAILPNHVREYMCTDLAFVPLTGANLNIDIGVAWRREFDNPAVRWLLDLINRYLVEQPELF